MNGRILTGLFLCIFFQIGIGAAQNSETSLSLVNPIWSNATGQYFSGVCTPYGMTKLGPDNLDTTFPSGYKPGAPIRGFSHTHLSAHPMEGTFGQILVMPQIGKPNFRQKTYEKTENESFNPAQYSATLMQNGGKIDVKLTANQNAGRHKWNFSKGESFPVSIVIDPTYCLAVSPKTAIKSHQFTVETDGSFWGKSSFSADNQSITVYYSGQLNLKNPTIIWRKDTTKLPNKKIKVDTSAFAFTGMVIQGEEVELILCHSFKNADEASQSLKRFLSQPFEETKKKTEMAWEDRLSVIQLPASSPEEKKTITTALYRTMICPTDVSGNHPEDQFGEAHFWDQTNLEEISSSIMPLHNLLFVPHQRRFFNSLIRTGESKNGLPEAWISGYYGKSEGGVHAEIILAEGQAKGIITGLDAGKAWKVCQKNAMEASTQPEWYGRSFQYLENGNDSPKNEAAFLRTVELASTDFLLAQLANRLGKTSDSKKLTDRSYRILQLFHPTKKVIWPKDSLGNWLVISSSDKKTNWFKPSSSWKAMLACQPLTDTLANLVGGKARFLELLDSISILSDFQQDAIYPFHIARAYYKLGQPQKAEMVLSKFRESVSQGSPLFDKISDPSASGMANYILAQAGIIPFPGTDEYGLVRPGMERMEMAISGGKTLVIKGKGKKAYWNGKEWKKPFFRHSDLLAGGTLEWK